MKNVIPNHCRTSNQIFQKKSRIQKISDSKFPHHHSLQLTNSYYVEVYHVELDYPLKGFGFEEVVNKKIYL